MNIHLSIFGVPFIDFYIGPPIAAGQDDIDLLDTDDGHLFGTLDNGRVHILPPIEETWTDPAAVPAEVDGDPDDFDDDDDYDDEDDR